jgi:hypothetical protein
VLLISPQIDINYENCIDLDVFCKVSLWLIGALKCEAYAG